MFLDWSHDIQKCFLFWGRGSVVMIDKKERKKERTSCLAQEFISVCEGVYYGIYFQFKNDKKCLLQ